MLHKHLFITLALVALIFPPAAAQETPVEAPAITTRQQLQKEATALRPLVKTKLAVAMLDAVPSLPAIETRSIYHNRSGGFAVRADRAGDIEPERLESWKKLELDEAFYYYTRYGTPLASVRAFDLATAAEPSLESVSGKKIVDFGYGTIGQLRLLASLGANVTGIEVDPVLHALYSYEGDAGAIARADTADGATQPPGSIKLVNGHWPTAKDVVEQVGGDCDLFISKNTLKRGYIHPERDVDPRMLVNLGVDDETYVNSLFEILKPGGIAIIYNICPALSKPDEPFKPWSDGRCPFKRELLEQAGFEVLKYNEDDTEFCKTMAKSLGWDESMDLKNDLFAYYTLLRKPRT